MKISLTILLMLIIAFSFGQRIQIKDGQILKDKVPVAKVDGEAKLIKGTAIN